MPLVDFDDPATWDGGPTSLYSDGTGRGFTRDAGPEYGGDHLILAEALDLRVGDSIILIGGAFGWGAETWIAHELGPIVVTDTSAWIHANKAANATLPILNENSLTAFSREIVLAALGVERATWCISEDVIAALSDEEAVALAAAMREMADNVVHWTTTRQVTQDPRLNWKSLEEWKALLSPDRVAARNERGRVL